jgi:hypothetical protein
VCRTWEYRWFQTILFYFCMLFSVSSWDYHDVRMLGCLNNLVLKFHALLSLSRSSLFILSGFNFVSIGSVTGGPQRYCFSFIWKSSVSRTISLIPRIFHVSSLCGRFLTLVSAYIKEISCILLLVLITFSSSGLKFCRYGTIFVCHVTKCL